jgi:hypothetical protein
MIQRGKEHKIKAAEFMHHLHFQGNNVGILKLKDG